jgi:hypothetical protein
MPGTDSWISPAIPVGGVVKSVLTYGDMPPPPEVPGYTITVLDPASRIESELLDWGESGGGEKPLR